MSFRSAPEQKPRPAPVMHDRAHLVVVAHVLERRQQVAAELRVPGVQRLGAVQLDLRGAAGAPAG